MGRYVLYAPSTPRERHDSTTLIYLHYYQERGRKRKRTMSTPSIVSLRPILTPRGPSTSPSRSRSPIRTLWKLLAKGTPAVHFKQVDQAILPEYVSKLKKSLLETNEKGIIPKQFEVSIISQYEAQTANAYRPSGQTQRSLP